MARTWTYIINILNQFCFFFFSLSVSSNKNGFEYKFHLKRKIPKRKINLIPKISEINIPISWNLLLSFSSVTTKKMVCNSTKHYAFNNVTDSGIYSIVTNFSPLYSN